MILKRKPHLYQWFGMLICVVGIVIVGIASHKSSGDDDETSRLNAVGNTLVVVAMLLSAVSWRGSWRGVLLTPAYPEFCTHGQLPCHSPP